MKEVKGANAPLLERHIRDEVAIENANGTHVPLYDPSDTTSEYGNLKSRTVTNRIGSAVKKVVYQEGDEKTLAIIKPDAIAAGKVDEIKSFILKNGYTIFSQVETIITPEKCSELYHEHETKSYYPELVSFLSRQVL